MKNFEKYKTAKERSEAFFGFKTECATCKFKPECNGLLAECAFFWLDLEAKEEKPLPCPLCGARMGVHGGLLKCTGCGLGFTYGITTNDVTYAFNLVAKAVMDSKWVKASQREVEVAK